MKNIWKIFQRDLQQIQKNVIAMIVIIGITVVPLSVCLVQYRCQLGSL